MTDNEQRTIGRLEAKIEALEQQQSAMREDHKAMMGELKQISKALSEAKGGLRTLIVVGSLSGLFGGLAVKLAPLLSFFPK